MDFSDFLPHMKDKVTWHKTPYPAIDPTRPELSQAGRSVLITGSSGGIGFFVARGFARAGAATVVLTGRDAASLSKAADELGAQYPGTKVVGKTVDIADPASIKSLWHGLEADGLVIDVLILSAASVQYEAATMLELGRERVMSEFAVNVGSNLELADYFYNQKKRDRGSKLALINISTMSIHNFDINRTKPNYAASKNAGTLVMQLVAQDVLPSDMQVISFHPGAIMTPSALKAGFTKDSIPWDSDDLPGHYAVWAASDEAAFLHGRFTWTAWDVDDLRTGELRKRIDSDPNYLKVGVVGL